MRTIKRLWSLRRLVVRRFLRSSSRVRILLISLVTMTLWMMCRHYGGRCWLPWQRQQPDIIIDELRNQWQQPVPLSPLLERLMYANHDNLTHVNAGVPSGALPASFACPNRQEASENLVPSEDMSETLEFQKMVPGNEDNYVFSAFFDRRWSPTPVVIVIGLSNFRSFPKYCRIWYRDDVIKEPHVTQVYYRYSPESHGHPYTAAFYKCFVRDNDVIPYAVSLLNDACAWHNVLKVMTSPVIPQSLNFTVCLSPIYNNYDDVRQFVEWIEVNRMYGAQHFVIYDYKPGKTVARYIEHFYRKSLGVVTVIPWSLPVAADYNAAIKVQIHSFGQVAAINDCLHRCLVSGSTFAVFSDVDELIVPRRHDTWPAMLDDVTSQLGPSSLLPGSYMFRSTLFRIDWTMDSTFVNHSHEYQLLKTLFITDREERIFGQFMRTKYIVSTKSTILLSIHMPSELVPSASSVQVSEHQCLVHHYRDWGVDPGPPPVHVTDRRMHRYADKIAHNTDTVHQWMTSRVDNDVSVLENDDVIVQTIAYKQLQ